MTPARFAQGGKGEQIGYTTARTPFGWIAVAATARGLCWLALAGAKDEAEASVREEFPAATLQREGSLARWVDLALEAVGASNAPGQSQTATELDLRARRFSCASGRLCGRFRAAKRAPTANWRARWACPTQPAPWLAPVL